MFFFIFIKFFPWNSLVWTSATIFLLTWSSIKLFLCHFHEHLMINYRNHQLEGLNNFFHFVYSLWLILEAAGWRASFDVKKPSQISLVSCTKPAVHTVNEDIMFIRSLNCTIGMYKLVQIIHNIIIISIFNWFS